MLEKLRLILRQDDGFTLAIRLNNGEALNVGLYAVYSDGIAVEATRGGPGQRYIPLSSIAYFDVEN